jgi:hypothetical protein
MKLDGLYLQFNYAIVLIMAGGFTGRYGKVMQTGIEPIIIKSIKDACIDLLEGLILSGELKI